MVYLTWNIIDTIIDRTLSSTLHLRVVDTSIIPEALTAHLNAASYMIGEMAADMIKQEWRGS